ncbi:hypothetical protein RBU61_00330 [Tissierella sp. MB52-C2]|uniref:hypothetical protein n=1 Tax=Tissierella sp. MB52-C2 TaxID=3070999 RepID=UPI00280AD60B|nr:hypothetical protein [Tissierella sp. MB52-C2]WMM25137.1 hypothetical protein RBU61_00330 [Tissierella sp. MB52-C2]
MKRKKLISVAVLMILLFNLSSGAVAGVDSGTTRPTIASIPSYEEGVEDSIVSPCGVDSGTTRPR